MKTASIKFNKLKLLGTLGISCLGYLAFISPHESVEAAKSVATHIGTFEGRTTFTTSSRNGINPGLFIEVMDDEGNLTQYESEEGIITIPNTKEGAYVIQAKLLGKTKYVDEETGEILDQFEEGRNLRLESVENPVLFTLNRRPTVIPYSAFENAIVSNDAGWTKFDLQLTLTDVDCYVKLNEQVESGRFKLNIEGFEALDNNDRIAVGVENSKSNVLSINEDITLRGIGNVRDELDLITGEVSEWTTEEIFNGEEMWFIAGNWSEGNTIAFALEYPHRSEVPFICDGFNSVRSGLNTLDSEGVALLSGVRVAIRVDKSKATNVEEFKKWLSQNNTTIIYKIGDDSATKMVDLTSTYSFKPINKDFIEVTGTVTPLVGSITVPTAPILFTLDPNQEAGRQFIAPEFSITNEANAPIRLILNRFEQTTQMLNDVLPDKYESWEGLNKQESKDIALALVPKVSDRWLSLNEGPRYVAGALSNELGTIKAKSSVDFTFSALHGQAFEETLSPSYRLGFTFEFMN